MKLFLLWANKLQDVLDFTKKGDFIAPLLLRLFLAPIFWFAGTKKLADIESTAAWFGNPDWGLGLPFPELLAWVAALTETGGAVLLVAGLAVRWISIPLGITMLVAAISAHWGNGWQAIADPGFFGANARVIESAERLTAAKSILQEHGNYEWLTGRGSIVILNNGIEFAATYFIMCVSLLFLGAGRFVSIDYWLNRNFRTKK
jgi:uncharacterized membrane protein YphA (DoxX/SURF4 family)